MAVAVVTGPITGLVRIPDGRQFDVTPGVVEVDDADTALALAEEIGREYADHGHPTDPNFTFVPQEG